MSQDLKITETVANTTAININTAFIVISTVIVVALAIWGYKKYKGMNIIKKTINEFGEISQNGKDNIIDDVDNTNGKISQT